MKFTIKKKSDWNFEDEVEINTLSDLKELQSKYRCSFNINFRIDCEEGKITIDDDFLE